MADEVKAPSAPAERPSRPFGERSGGDRPRFGGGGGGRSGPGGPPREGGRKFFRRKKVCKFCTEKIADINYKDYRLLGQFVAESGKLGDQAGAQHCVATVRGTSIVGKAIVDCWFFDC
jgi:small subunit ribosomal protein S18